MNYGHGPSNSLSLAWVSTTAPAASLDSATWLDTTRELLRLGWRVALIGKGAAGWREFRGVEVLCLPHPPLYFLGQWVFHLHVLRFLIGEWSQLDVILFHQISALWLLPLRVIRHLSKRNRPLLVMDTRDLPDFSSSSLKLRVRKWFYNLVYWMAARWADGQTAITPRMAKLVDIPQAQLWGVWPSGVNPKTFAQSQADRRWPSAGEPIKLIYIGRLLRERNLLSLCQAVTQANVAGMKFVLTLVGDGADRAELEAFAAKTNGQIHISPPAPHEQMPSLLTQAHIGVTSLPAPNQSKYEASSPVKLFEYMAAGMPILSTRNVCHTDVVRAGTYAFWAKDASERELLSALRQVWQHRDTLSHLSSEAAAAAQNWTWQAAAQKLSDALSYGLQQVDE